VSPWSSEASSTNTPLNATRSSIEHLIALVWSRRWLFSITAILSTTALVCWAFLARPVYKVTVTLIPQQNDNGGAMASLLGDAAGAAGLMGLGMLGQGGTDQEAIALLESRSLFQTFVARENVLPVLFWRDWSSTKHQWRSPDRIPTMDDAWKLYDRHVRDVDEDKQTGVVKFSISWINREQAASWANELVKLANSEMRQRALKESQDSLHLLQTQLEAARSVELQGAISRIMEMEINKEVSASARQDYAFAVMDQGVVPDVDKFTSPRRDLILLVAFPVGCILGMVIVFLVDVSGDLRRILKRVRSADPQHHDL